MIEGVETDTVCAKQRKREHRRERKPQITKQNKHYVPCTTGLSLTTCLCASSYDGNPCIRSSGVTPPMNPLAAVP